MDILWKEEAWEEYLLWQTEDRRTLKKINFLLLDIKRRGYNSLGKPEPLKGKLSGFWSVRIDKANRIVFRINNGNVEVFQCGSHYGEK